MLQSLWAVNCTCGVGGLDRKRYLGSLHANSVDVLDTTTELWEQKRSLGTPPTGYWDTAYTVAGSCLFVFGESGGRSHHNSLFKLPLNTFQWEKVRASNPSSSPQRKTNFGMVSDGDNQLVIFSGYTEGGRTHRLYAFNMSNSEYSVHIWTVSQRV